MKTVASQAYATFAQAHAAPRNRPETCTLLYAISQSEGQVQPTLIRKLFMLKQTLHVKLAADVGPFDPENLFLEPHGLGPLKR